MFVTQIFDECAEILGTTDKSKVFRKISQAVQTLMESGHWTHSTAEVDVCTGWDECSIALPRGVSVPLAVNVDGSPVYFRNRLFQYHVNAGGKYNPVEWAWDDRGYVATLMEIIQSSELVAVAESSNDVGKTIRVVGTDNLNRQIRSQLPDGTGVDGLLVPINSISDFAFGVITPSGANVATREVAVTPIQNFKSATAHQLNSGQGMSVTAQLPGLIPVPLSDGQTYYIGVVDAFTIKLFNDSLNAQSGDYPVSLQSIIGAGLFEFLDQRPSQVITSLRFATPPSFPINIANQISFPEGQQLPAPLKTKTTYYANLIDENNLEIFPTEDKAKNNYDAIYTVGSTSDVLVDIRKTIAPETKITFNVPHLFQDGDQVQAFTAGGVLPRPLILNKNYFVNIIDSKTITLHENKSDADQSTISFFVNPITLITPPSGIVSLVKLIPAAISVGKSNQVSAPGFSVPVPTGSGAQFTAVAVGSVTSVRVSSQGSNYTSEPTVTFSDPPVPPIGQQARTAKGYAIRNTAVNTIVEVIITDAGAGYSVAPIITINPPTSNSFAVTSIVTDPFTNIATVTTAVPHGFANGAQVLISNASPNDYNGVRIINTPTTNTFNYTVSSPLPSATGNITASLVASGNTASATASITTSFVSRFIQNLAGSDYTQEPQVKIEGGGGSGATAKANIFNGQVTSLEIITQGSGYTSPPQVIITPSTGVFVEFQSTGALPNPLTGGTAYRIENPSTSNTFTILQSDYSEIDVRSVGSGSIFLVLIRAFGVSFTGNWLGDYTNLNLIEPIYFGTDFILPLTTPSIDDGITEFWLRKDNNKTAKVYNTQSNAQAGGQNGQVVATFFGTGQTYFGIRLLVTPSVYNDLIKPSNIQFIEDNEIVVFESSGTLPFPLSINQEYSIKIFGSNIKAFIGNNLVNIQTPGTGQLFTNIKRIMTASPSTSIHAPACFYETGENAIVRASEGDVLPDGLNAGTTYFVRKIASDTFELYNTLANAENLVSNTGRIEFLTTGNKTTSKFFVDSVQGPVLVKTVAHIEKPKTDGYVSLYAWDYGRSNDLTLIGQYHPDEINPQYRRIRIGKRCAWARIAYRLTPPTVTSIYDYIPLEHERAIITAVHACDLEDKDFAEQATRYWGIAFQYLKSQQEHIDGHAFSPPQIQNLVYADGEDPVVF